jgi:hypothetical protein
LVIREIGLELGDFGEMEIVDFHGGDDHLEGFFAGGADGGAAQFDVVEHFDDGLIEALVADSGSRRTACCRFDLL